MNKNLDWIKYILENDDIEKAKKQVYTNKGSAGIDGVTVYELGEYIDKNIKEIIYKVYKRKYNPTPVRRVEIPKEKKKSR